VVHESPLRVEKLVAEIKALYGESTEIRVASEMTKMFEKVGNGVGEDERGEVVVVFCERF